MRRLLHAAVAVSLVAGILVGAAPPASADQGEGVSATVNDQERRLTVGGLHVCAVLDTGAVQCWGNNDQGQLGNGTRTTSSRPVPVSGLGAVLAVAGGAQHTCALVHGGRVRCWGLDGSGQLGDGDLTGATKLTAVSVRSPDGSGELSGVTAVATGSFHSCAIRNGGEVWCWGLDGSGQLGDDDLGETHFLPVRAQGISSANPAVALAAGEFHTCAVLADGTVRCWGHNGLGQLGDGTTTDRATPTAVPAITSANGARALTAGASHTCVLLADGTARCWGLNNEGQLGNGTTTDSATPVTVSGLTATAISAAVRHTCALLSGGSVKCWGDNGRSQLGYTELLPSDRLIPHLVSGVAGASAVTTGGFESCAVVGSSIRCWGYDFYGQLGSYVSSSTRPVTVTALSDAATVSVGDGHACAVLTTGAPVCWGDNGSGQLGAPVGADSRVPVPMSGLGSVAQISAANRFTCVLPSGSGTPQCNGANGDGQLGDGTTTARTAPAAVSGLTAVSAIGAGGALGSAERGHACAVLTDGTGRCWGRNANGQLGDDTTTDRSAPVAVVDLSGASSVAAGGFHSCALVAGGAVRCWGFNGSGQIGDNTTTQRTKATAVSGLSGASAVTAGAEHSCALLATQVKCWGENGSGQLGDGTTTDRHTPVTVTGIGASDPPTAIAAGDDHTCALLDSSKILCWGDNGDGQLGDGTTGSSDEPVLVASLAPPSGYELTTAIAAGRRNTCARLVDRSVRCWGDNTHGQLGDGIDQESVTPRTVQGLATSVATNHIPDAVDDVATTAPLTSTSVAVLANDTDADGDTLSLVSVSVPGKGTASTAGNLVTYTPGPSACDPASATYGKDQFTYAVTDGLALVPATVLVTITCPNRPPVGTDDTASATEDTAVVVDVLANDTDPDGDTLTVTAVSDPPGGTATIVAGGVQYTPDPDRCGSDAFTYTVGDGNGGFDIRTVSVSIACVNDGPIAVDDLASTSENTPVVIDVRSNDSDADATDTLTVTAVTDPPHGSAVRNADNTVTYTPDPGYCGADEFDYSITDGTSSDVGHVSITVSCTQDGPHAADDSARTSEDTPVLVDVLANDSDPDGDPLTVSAVGIPGHGTAEIVGNQVRYTPDPDFCGADSFGYTITDGTGFASAMVVPVEIVCAQDPPVAVADSATANEDTPVAIDVLANDRDPDGDALSVASVTDPPRGTAVIGATGRITYTPDADLCGNDGFDYTISDGHGNHASAHVAVAVACVNDPPVIAPLESVTTRWGDTAVVLVSASDVDGDPLTYSLVSPPAGASISPSGAISWTPMSSQVGSFTLTVRVSDGQSGIAQRSFSVVVGKRPTSLVYTGVAVAQYSDSAAVSATLSDGAWGTPVGAGRTVSFSLGGASTSTSTGGGGTASTTIVVGATPGSASLEVSFAGDAAHLPASVATAFSVLKERVEVMLTGGFVTDVAGEQATVPLTARVAEEADGRLGSGLGGVQVSFGPLGGGTWCSASVSSAGNGTGTASCNATIPRGAHAVVVSIASPLYAGPVDVSGVAVGSTATGAASGAGRIVTSTVRDDFAFLIVPASKKVPAEGSGVHVFRSADGLRAIVVRSSQLTGSSNACSGGKTKVCSVHLDLGGATAVEVTLDGGTASTMAGTSTVAVDARVPDRYAVSISGAVSRTVGNPSNPVAITSGTIVRR